MQALSYLCTTGRCRKNPHRPYFLCTTTSGQEGTGLNNHIGWMRPPLYGTEGRGVAGAALMIAIAASRPGELAVTRISPVSLPACTIAIASPLNALRLSALSGSWQLGSPLPTPR